MCVRITNITKLKIRPHRKCKGRDHPDGISQLSSGFTLGGGEGAVPLTLGVHFAAPFCFHFVHRIARSISTFMLIWKYVHTHTYILPAAMYLWTDNHVSQKNARSGKTQRCLPVTCKRQSWHHLTDALQVSLWNSVHMNACLKYKQVSTYTWTLNDICAYISMYLESPMTLF